MRCTAQDIYNKLINEDQILSTTGQIRFYLGDVSIIVKHNDVVGNIIQEWLEEWLVHKEIDFNPNPNTQMPPDVFLNPDDHTKNLLEIKAFNRENSPGFDIADFKAFAIELINKPYHLDTDFLIFGYKMSSDSGDIVIKDVWLKKMWEIMKPASDWPITLQVKQGKVHKIRPCNWYTTRGRSGPVFSSKTDFLAAFEQTVYQCSDTNTTIASQWKNRFKQSYRNYYGEDINFPRWDDIKEQYGWH